MELREFAERVLFSTSLEEKLRWVEGITDEHPGLAQTTPQAPGRPAELHFKAHASGKAEFPGLRRLEDERERGKLLHFFANHELLATELMALVLLRFPNAPAAFRRGVLQTLKDEQMHTRLYLKRMKECGIHFGELPVSGYFWRTVSGMENPLDYVSSLSLTFEQANLDFARHFAQGFAAVGDAATAKLLDKIYHDEIGHVAYGLKWFRRWKNPDESDWDAFCRQLKFPLSPQRAKGFAINFEGRRLAGLDPEFIARLDVYSQSKGRTPNVFVFNPFAEGRIAGGKAFNPARHQAQLARDLENLPQFLCRQDDIVLVHERPSMEFLSGIKQAGFALPEFVEMGKTATVGRVTPCAPSVASGPAAGRGLPALPQGVKALAGRKLGTLRPWAWGPDSVELLEPLFEQVTGEKRKSGERFNQGIAQLYSKAWSAELLRRVLARSRRGDEAEGRTEPDSASSRRRLQTSGSGDDQSLLTSAANNDWLCGLEDVGVAVDSVEAALRVIQAIRARGHHKVVAKEALGVAGSNAMRFFEPEILETQRRWLANALRGGRQLVIEPWLERVADFSVQLEMGPGGLKLCGYTGLINDARGQFLGNWAETHHHRRIPTKVVSQFSEAGDISGRFLRLYADIFSLLEKELREAGHVGPVGIDAFVYRTANGHCRLKPIVEINPRYTMGRVMVELMTHASQGSCGTFRLVSRAITKAEGFDDFVSYGRALIGKHPLKLEDGPTPKIREGALCLNDPVRAQVCLAVFQVGRVV